MAVAKRLFFFFLTNILVVATISIVTSVFGLNRYLSASGINYTALMLFCLVWGMGGAFISLLLSKTMVKWSMGVQIIDPNTRDPNLRPLVDRVHRLARSAGIEKMPEVGIYESPELNAFATGPTRNNSLVAVSTGLLNGMSEAEVEGVLGHEVAHVANGDMVTMTLIQGVVNAFAMFFARIIAFAVSNFVREELGWIVRFVVTIVLDILFTILGSMVVAAFSRYREFRADAGGAKLAGREKMIAALEALRRHVDLNNPNEAPAMNSMKISSKSGGLLALFSTHPPLEKRIQALRSGSAMR
jgi:heat shock protein HtpX